MYLVRAKLSVYYKTDDTVCPHNDTAPYCSVVTALIRRQHDVTNEMALYSLINSHTGATIIREIAHHRTIRGYNKLLVSARSGVPSLSDLILGMYIYI